MTTSKPFATISYNSEKFLKDKLDTLIEQDFIDFYAFIPHLKEEDETKNHIHLYIVPSTKINTKSIFNVLEEKDPLHEKPLGCMPAVSSRFADWYMYCLHDKRYLMSKGQTRKHCYTRCEFVCSSNEFMDDCIHRIDRSKWVGNETIINAVKDNIPFDSLVRSGIIPIQLIHQYKCAYELLEDYNGRTQRNGRETHTPAKPVSKPVFVHPSTGEVIDNADSVDLPECDIFDNGFDYVQQGLIDD